MVRRPSYPRRLLEQTDGRCIAQPPGCSSATRAPQPTPDVEIEFWKVKANNLNSIFDQLQSNRIRRVLRALDLSKSTYCTTFARSVTHACCCLFARLPAQWTTLPCLFTVGNR